MNNALIEVTQGKIQGQEENNAFVFKGIPFAKPPVDELRFQAPEPPKNWEGVREATSFGPACPQNPGPASMQGVERKDMAEDCLYLNIWAPAGQKDKLPVMVWIHGGAFRSGAGSASVYDGSRLAAEGDVIVVTLNYRLGALGFLHLSGIDDSYPANLGLLDQVAALTWVKENIEAFGGDPDNVTVFGESAGAMSIASLLAMPAATGLFQQAILESGAEQVMAKEQATAITQAVMQLLGISAANFSEMKKVPVEAIVQAGEKVSQQLNGAESILLFQPVVDGRILPQSPSKAIMQGAAKGIKLLVGTNRDEGSFFLRPGTAPLPESEADAVLHKLIGQEAAGLVKNYYPATIDGQAQFLTDFVFWKPAVELATMQSQHAPVWMYRFDWHIPGHPYVGKAVHALEIPFVFNNLDYFSAFEVPIDRAAWQLARRMQDSWISFAWHGEPGQDWPVYDTENRPTKVFDREDEIVHDPDPEKRALVVGR